MIPQPEVGPIREGFIRQRRNLIIISLLLLFAETSELAVNKINVFGNDLTIANPVVVTLALVLAYLYWLYRYSVYFHDIGPKGLAESVGQRLSKRVDRWARKKWDRDREWRDLRLKEVFAKLAKDNPNVAVDRTQTSRVIEGSTLGPNDEFTNIQAQVRIMLYDLTDENRQTNLTERRTEFIITGYDAVLLRVRAILYVLIRTRIFSEYYLPFFIALAPLAYWLWKTVVA